MGFAGMMLETAGRLSKVVGKAGRLEGRGILLGASELRRFFMSAPAPDQKLVDWARRQQDEARFFIYAEEE